MISAAELLRIEGPTARWTLADYQSELQNPDSKDFVMQDPAGKITGFVLYRIFPDGLEIMNLAVREKGRGFGKELMESFLKSLESELSEIRLEVSSQNAAALALYKKAGFTEYHRRRQYYKDSSDAVLMKRLK